MIFKVFGNRSPCVTSRVVAGALESLSALAHAHLELGVASPFLVSA